MTLPTCCTSRVGLVKKKYATKEQADRAVAHEWDKYKVRMEVYPCRQRNGYHLRKKR